MMPENDQSPVSLPVPAKSNGQTLWRAVALLALLLAGWQWFDSRQKLADIRQEVAQRMAEASEERGARNQLREQVESLHARLGAVDGRLAEFKGQSETLQALYQDVARSREEAILLDVEQALTLAGQQLKLAGNVAMAKLVLQTADAQLARLDQPRYLPLRKALAKDLERLNALPFVDVSGISLHIEQVVAGVDKLPLAAYARPPEKAKKVEEKATPEVAPAWWQLLGSELWLELKGLIRIQRFDLEEPVLLAPGQSFFLRENLKLRLLNARLALLARDQPTFRHEMKVAEEWLGRYFDTDDKAVQGAQAVLHPLASSEIAVELPSLNESQGVLRSLRQSKEKR